MSAGGDGAKASVQENGRAAVLQRPPPPADGERPEAAARQAFVTLLTSDAFLMGIQALISSLKAHHPTRALLVLHTDAVSPQCLSRIGTSGVELRRVEVIPNPYQTNVPAWQDSALTKLRIWEQVDFQKLVYIDADCIVLSAIDELFDRPSPAFCPDVFPPDRFNAGVIVLEPSADLFQEMLAAVGTLPSHDGGDTGFLNSFFKDWYSWSAPHRMPFGYNALRTMYWFTHKNQGYWNAIQPVKVLHFCSSPKPWDPEAKKGDLEAIWWEHYLRSQLDF